MTKNINHNWFRIDEQSSTPKYLQITNAVLKALETGELQEGALLPSINELSFELDISRDTAEKSYRHLKKLGVIGSVPGKGYFIAQTDFRQHIKVFLLFNKLSAHKKIIYDSLVKTLGEKAAIDFYIYNNDFNLFKKLIEQRRVEYTHHVIIPHFLEGGEGAADVINKHQLQHLILLDKRIAGIQQLYGAVYEDFDKDIYQALEQAKDRLSQYQTLRIIFPDYTYHPTEILNGFVRFCDQYAFNYSVIRELPDEPIQKGDVLICLMENDLVTCIEKVLAASLEVGKDVGVISYNETPIKKIILNGITTISTDFHMMGTATAKMILSGETTHCAAPFYLTIRNSL